MHLVRLLCLLALFSLVGYSFAQNDAVVRNADFAAMRNELADLRKTHANQKQLDELWRQSQNIAEMNDRCGNISLTDVLDPECSKFYRDQLPQFEEDFMRVTGEIRLSVMSPNLSGYKQRVESLKACSQALSQFFLGSEQLIGLKMNRDLGLEPLNNDGTELEVSYDFTLSYDKRRLRTLKNLAEMWVSVCGDVVLNPETKELAPLFVNNLNAINDSIALNTDLDVKMRFVGYKVVFSSTGRKYGQYYLGGKELFSSGRDFGSYLIIDLDPSHGGIVENLVKSQDFSGRKKIWISYSGYTFEELEGHMVWGTRYGSYDDEPESSSSSYVSMFAHVRSSSSSSNYSYNTYSTYNSYDYDSQEVESSDSGYESESDSEESEDESGSEESISASIDESDDSTPLNVKLRPSMMLGINLSTGGTADNAAIEKYPALAGDSVTYVHGYLVGQLVLDLEKLTLGMGAGLAWGYISAAEVDSRGDAKPVEDIRNYTALMLNLELGYFDEFELEKTTVNDLFEKMSYGFGVRSSMIFDTEWPTLYVTPFLEFGCVGVELGLQYAQDFWANVYVGFYLRIPTLSMWRSIWGD